MDGQIEPLATLLPLPLLTHILTVGWKLGSLPGYKSFHYAVVEAPYPSKAACTSMCSSYKMFEPLHMQWMGIWNHQQPVTIALVDPDFDSQLNARCMNHLICSGWAYGTIGNPLPLPMLTQILTVSWKLGSLLGYKPYHYAVVEAPFPSKAACTSMWSTYKVYELLNRQWTSIWNHCQPVTTALVWIA